MTIDSRDRMVHALIRVPPGTGSLRFSLRNLTTGKILAESPDLLMPEAQARISEAGDDPFAQFEESEATDPFWGDHVIVRDEDDRESLHVYAIFDAVGEIELRVRWGDQAAAFRHRVTDEEEFGGLIDTANRFINEGPLPAPAAPPEIPTQPVPVPVLTAPAPRVPTLASPPPGRTHPVSPVGEDRLASYTPEARARVRETLVPLRARGVGAVPELLALVARAKPEMSHLTRVMMNECDDRDSFCNSQAALQCEALCLLCGLGPEAAPALHKAALSGDNRAERQVAVHALGFLGNGESPAVLLGLLQADDGTWTLDAEESLRMLGPAATPALLEAATPETPQRAASVFTVLKARAGRPFRTEEEMTREEAALVLRHALGFIMDRNDRPRIWSQTLVSDFSAKVFLWGRLADHDPGGIRAAVPLLVRALEEQDDYTVRSVLGTLTGSRNSPPWEASQWREWYLDRWVPETAAPGAVTTGGSAADEPRDHRERLRLAATLDPAELECALILERRDTPGRAAAAALRRAGVDAADALAAAVAGDPDAAARRAAVLLLGFIPLERSLQAITSLLGNAAVEETALADEAARALSRLGNASYHASRSGTQGEAPPAMWEKRVTADALELLRRGPAPVKLGALRALRGIRSRGAPLSELLNAMRDPDAGVRSYAVIIPSTFTSIGDNPWEWGEENWQSLHLRLAERLDDPSTEVRIGALRTLNFTGSQKSAAAWRQWAREQRR